MKNFLTFASYFAVIVVLSSSMTLMPAFIFDTILKLASGPQKSWAMILISGLLMLVAIGLLEKKCPGNEKIFNLIGAVTTPFTKRGIMILTWILAIFASNILIVDVIFVGKFGMDINMMGVDTLVTGVIIIYGAALFLRANDSQHNRAE